MEKKIAGLLGAMATLGAFNAAQAAPTPAPSDVLRANSFAELLEPIPNAVALLKVVDESRPNPSAERQRSACPILPHHHHHHHHHHGSAWISPGMDMDPWWSCRDIGVYHHHHHHHHHSFYPRGY